jgi:gluconate 2-dehydrogenase gamma chain
VPDVSNPEPQKLNRRTLLVGAVLLVGGAAALMRLQRKEPRTPGENGFTLDARKFALIEQVCEAIIPATDTPGAIGAGVPAFMREMIEAWATEASRAEIAAVLDGIEKLAWSRFGTAFLELLPERRSLVMAAFDEERIGRQDAAYGKFKYLVLAGYYHSEIGATQELRFELVPGAWRSCVPLSEIGRTSAV